MKRWIVPVALLTLLLLPATAFAQGIGLTPEKAKSNVEVIKYVTIFIVGSVVIFLLLIRLTIIPFLVKNYYSLADATNIGLSLFILYALNFFTLLFFRYSLSTGWRMVFLVVAMFWMIHLLLKVILAKRNTDD